DEHRDAERFACLVARVDLHLPAGDRDRPGAGALEHRAERYVEGLTARHDDGITGAGIDAEPAALGVYRVAAALWSAAEVVPAVPDEACRSRIRRPRGRDDAQPRRGREFDPTEVDDDVLTARRQGDRQEHGAEILSARSHREKVEADVAAREFDAAVLDGGSDGGAVAVSRVVDP